MLSNPLLNYAKCFLLQLTSKKLEHATDTKNELNTLL